MTPVDVEQEVGAGIGDIEQIRRVVGRAERRDLVGRRRPSRGREIVLHRLGDGVTVGVVRRQIGGLLVLAEGLDHHRADRRRRRLAVEALAEAVAHAVLAGGVVRAGNRDHVEDVFALGELVERHRDRRRRRTGHQYDLVLGDEALLRLDGFVRLGGRVGNDELHLLAEHALLGLGRDLLDQVMPELRCSTASCMPLSSSSPCTA